MKKFRCMPAFLAVPLLMGGMTLFPLYLLLSGSLNFVNSAGEPDQLRGVIGTWIFLALAWLYVLCGFHLALWRVELHPDRAVCKGLFPWERFEIPYEDCNAGFEYHEANGQTFWWLYICQGAPPKYPAADRRNRISKEKIRPGFIKMTYSDEVYEALVQVLPKRQRDYLTSSRRFVGIDAG